VIKRFAPVAFSLVIVGCTTTDEIIIDQQGVDMTRYQSDLEQCQVYSEQVKTGEKAVRGAASGAVVGGLIGAAVGDSRNAQEGAGVGAISGGAKGASQGAQSEVQVVKNCLRGRGYRVLN
jgi:outer membrane lipoprotein SlyB